jgi:mortality factor 4-like protein 1
MQNRRLTAKQEEEFMRRPAVRLFIPDTLKSILVDDWEKVTKDQKLVPMPAPVSVSTFLNDYYEAESVHRRPNSADADILEEVIAGIKEYFNKSLGRILLYRFERPQFFTIHKELESGSGEHAGQSLCDMYGCEHLLRLFGT